MGRPGILFTIAAAALALTACGNETASQAQSSPQVNSYRLAGDGIAINGSAFLFGANPDVTLSALESAWGEPTADTGWAGTKVDWGWCGGTTARVVEWGSLKVVFNDQPEAPALTTWRLQAPLDPRTPPVVVTPRLNDATAPFSLEQSLDAVREAYGPRLAKPYLPDDSYWPDAEPFAVMPMERESRDTPVLYSEIMGAHARDGRETILVMEAGGVCGV